MVVDIYNTDKKYKIIYAVSPWFYSGWKKENKSAASHYNVMKTDEIMSGIKMDIVTQNAVILASLRPIL